MRKLQPALDDMRANGEPRIAHKEVRVPGAASGRLLHLRQQSRPQYFNPVPAQHRSEILPLRLPRRLLSGEHLPESFPAMDRISPRALAGTGGACPRAATSSGARTCDCATTTVRRVANSLSTRTDPPLDAIRATLANPREGPGPDTPSRLLIARTPTRSKRGLLFLASSTRSPLSARVLTKCCAQRILRVVCQTRDQ